MKAKTCPRDRSRRLAPKPVPGQVLGSDQPTPSDQHSQLSNLSPGQAGTGAWVTCPLSPSLYGGDRAGPTPPSNDHTHPSKPPQSAPIPAMKEPTP